MARKEHNLDEVFRALGKKHDCSIDYSNMRVLVLTGNSNNPKATPKKNDLGNGSWGKIDFLVNHKGFAKVMVDKFPKQQRL